MIRISRVTRRIAAAVVLCALAAQFFGTARSVAASSGTRGADMKAVCPAATPGTAQCLALLRTDIASLPELAVSALTPPPGYGPADLQSAYALPSGSAGCRSDRRGCDAYDLPTAEADLGVYRSQFGLPACTTANGCFRKVDQNGGASYPAADRNWGIEIALDIDMVSAVCPNCHILLVEANDNRHANLGTAVDTAVSLGAIAVSNSYGGPEWSGETSYDTYYNHPGVAITAATGDCGYNCTGVYKGSDFNSVEYPAASPVCGRGRRHEPDARREHPRLGRVGLGRRLRRSGQRLLAVRAQALLAARHRLRDPNPGRRLGRRRST